MITIAPASDQDIAAIDCLWHDAFPDDAPHNRAPVAVPQKLALADDMLLVARDGNRLIGSIMAGYDGHRGWLYAVAVANDYRRTGLGTQLVRAAEAALQAKGCRKINLQVREGNAAVAAFYARLGYAVEPRISMGRLID
jgi:ribosomal protein S18 acetylase RimI-like enzyme